MSVARDFRFHAGQWKCNISPKLSSNFRDMTIEHTYIQLYMSEPESAESK